MGDVHTTTTYICKMGPKHCDKPAPCLKITRDATIIVCNQLTMTVEYGVE